MLEAQTLSELCRTTLASEPSVRAAFVFGSVARGTAQPTSDVDIAVVGHDIDLLGLAAKLSSVLQAEVDVVEIGFETAIPLLRSVLRDGVRMYEQRPGAAADFLSRARFTVELDGPGYDRMVRAFMKRVAQRGVGA